MDKAQTLTDAFTTRDTGKWYWTGAEASVVGGALYLPASTEIQRVESQAAYDLIESHFAVQVLQVPNVSGSETRLLFEVARGPDDWAQILWYLGVIYFRERAAGVQSQTNIPFNATDHAWWRIRMASGILYWETSPNGMTWTVRRSKTTTINFDAVRCKIEASSYNSPDPGVARLDNLNLLPGSPISVPVGQANETGTGTAVPRLQRGSWSNAPSTLVGGLTVTIGQAHSNVSALALVGRRKSRGVSSATVAHSALAVLATKAPIHSVNRATETPTAFQIGHTKAVRVGVATEQEFGRTITRTKVLSAGLSGVENETATTVTRKKVRTSSLTTDVETARPLSHKRARQLGSAVVSVSATPVRWTKRKALVQAVQASSATSVARTEHRTLGRAIESSSGRPLSRARAYVLGQAVATVTARTTTRTQQGAWSNTLLILNVAEQFVAVSTATELDRGYTAKLASTVAPCVESDTAGAVGRTKRYSLGQATETTTAATVGHAFARAVARATETAGATVVAFTKALALGTAVETTVATPVSANRQHATLGVATEAGQTVAVGRVKELASDAAEATEYGRFIARAKAISVGTATEVASGIPLTLGVGVSIGIAVEVDTATGTVSERAYHLARVDEYDVATIVSQPLRSYYALGYGAGGYILSPKVVLLGQAVEDDSGTTGTVTKVVPVTQAAAELDSGTLLGRPKAAQVGVAVESSSSIAVESTKTYSINVANEICSTTLISRLKARATGQPIANESAVALTHTVSQIIGQASISESASIVGHTKRLGTGQAVEVSNVSPVGGEPIRQAVEFEASTSTHIVKVRRLAIPTESSTATLPRLGRGIAVRQAVENDSAATIARAKLLHPGRAVEMDSASTASRTKTVTVGQGVETDNTSRLSTVRRLLVGTTAESATRVTAVKTRVVGQANEPSLATPVGHYKRRTLSQVIEDDAANLVARPKARLLGESIENGLALLIEPIKSVRVGQANEIDVAHKAASYGFVDQATEVETATRVTVFKTRVINQVSSTESATRPVVGRGLRTSSETDSAWSISRAKVRILGRAVENDSGGRTNTGRVYVVSTASISETATAIGVKKARSVGTVTEVGTVTAVGRLKIRFIGRAEEFSSGQPTQAVRSVTLSRAVEQEAIAAIDWLKNLAVGQVIEQDTAEWVATAVGQLNLAGIGYLRTGSSVGGRLRPNGVQGGRIGHQVPVPGGRTR